jgi:O-antigen ligase
MNRVASWAALALLVALPWTTWIVLVPSLGQDEALYTTPTYLFLLGMFLVTSLVVAWYDPWLGIFSAYMTVRALWTTTPFPANGALHILLSSVAIVILQRTSEKYRRWASWMLVGSAGLEILVALGQAFGVNPIWHGLQQDPFRVAHGTLGNSGHLGALVGITFALVPGWLVPWWILGIVLSQSFAGAMAMLVVACMRWRQQWGKLMVGTAAGLVALYLVRPFHLGTLGLRWLSWAFGGSLAWQAPIFGHGPKSWEPIVRAQQIARPDIFPELFRYAHNELLQLFFEAGLVGVVILFAWICYHQAWKKPLLVALGVVAFWWPPFRVPTLLPISILAIGLAGAQGAATSQEQVRQPWFPFLDWKRWME